MVIVIVYYLLSMSMFTLSFDMDLPEIVTLVILSLVPLCLIGYFIISLIRRNKR